MATVFTVVGVTKLIYEVLNRDYGVPTPTGAGGGGNLGTGTGTGTGAGGLTQAQVEAIVAQAVAALPASGVSEAQVQTAVAAAVAELPLQALLDLLAVKQGATVADVEAVWQSLSDTSTGYVQLLSILSGGKPVSQGPTIADVRVGLPIIVASMAAEWAKGDTAASTGVIGAYLSAFNQQLTDEVNTRDEQTKLLNKAYQDLRTGKAEQSALDGVSDRVTALEGAALSGEGVSQEVVDALLARLESLERDNAKLKGQVLTLAENSAYALEETQRLEAQDAEIVAFVIEKYVPKEFIDGLEGAIINQFGGVGAQVTAVEKLVQDVMNAINGPNATPQTIAELFWLLNDVIAALVEATGINFPGGGK